MKATSSWIASLAIFASFIGNCSVNAQDFFFDKKWEDGKMTSKVKYELGDAGLYEKNALYEYSYDDLGNFKEQSVYIWDWRKEKWIPSYRIVSEHDNIHNIKSLAYGVWNKRKNQFEEPVEKMVYQFDELKNEFSYLAFMKNNKLREEINENSDDRDIEKFVSK